MIAGDDQVHQLEDLKRTCLKKEKKAKGRATGVAAIWKVKTWGGGAGAKGKGAAGGEDIGAAFVEEPESAVVDEEVEEEEEEDEEVKLGWKHLPELTYLPTYLLLT